MKFEKTLRNSTELKVVTNFFEKTRCKQLKCLTNYAYMIYSGLDDDWSKLTQTSATISLICSKLIYLGCNTVTC